MLLHIYLLIQLFTQFHLFTHHILSSCYVTGSDGEKMKETDTL